MTTKCVSVTCSWKQKGILICTILFEDIRKYLPGRGGLCLSYIESYSSGAFLFLCRGKQFSCTLIPIRTHGMLWLITSLFVANYCVFQSCISQKGSRIIKSNLFSNFVTIPQRNLSLRFSFSWWVQGAFWAHFLDNRHPYKHDLN